MKVIGFLIKDLIVKYEKRALHITGLYMLRARWALRGCGRLGRLRLPRLPPPTICQPRSFLRKALIRAGKTSYTPGTLYAIASIIVKIYSDEYFKIIVPFSIVFFFQSYKFVLLYLLKKQAAHIY
jgi:hypothetical protein